VIKDTEVARASHNKIETESLFQQALSDYTPTVIQDRPRTILFFTDSSGYEGQVGASAVAPRKGIFQRRYLGTIDESTVYVAELNSIEIAIARFVEQKQQHNISRPIRLVIFSDCQAAIQAVQIPKRSSGQFVLHKIYDHIRALRSQMPTFDQIPIEIR
jgi:hypothetical protein